MKRERASIVTLLLLIIAAIAQANLVHSENVVVVSSNGWIDSVGWYEIHGEVQNVGSFPVGFVQISATFYDSDNKVVDTSSSFAYLTHLPPSAKSPFMIMSVESSVVTLISRYSLQVTSMPQSPLQQGLQILSNSSYTDAIGYLHVVGEVQNVGAVTSSFTQVFATFYDANGRVIDTATTFTNPADIDAGNKSPFELYFIDTNQISLISTYSLTAQSSVYSIVTANLQPTPEAPTGTPRITSTPVPIATPSIPEFSLLEILIVAAAIGSLAILSLAQTKKLTSIQHLQPKRSGAAASKFERCRRW